jgi:hypothetical protein
MNSAINNPVAGIPPSKTSPRFGGCFSSAVEFSARLTAASPCAPRRAGNRKPEIQGRRYLTRAAPDCALLVSVLNNYQRYPFRASINWINIIAQCEAGVSDLSLSSLSQF